MKAIPFKEFLFDENNFKKESPRQAWILKHDIQTFYTKDMKKPWPPWTAWQGIDIFAPEELGYGITEDEAIADYCKMRGISLWNEEEYVKQKLENKND